MRKFTRVIILLTVSCFLFSNCSFALRSTAYDESSRKIKTAFSRLEPHYQDNLFWMRYNFTEKHP